MTMFGKFKKITRLFLKGEKGKPAVVICPTEMAKGRIKKMNYLEKMQYYRALAKGTHIVTYRKDVVKKIGGFDPTLGFGEDRIFQEKVSELLRGRKL